MNTPANIQTILQDGKPVFVVIPFDEYLRLFPEAAGLPEGKPIPREVVGLTIGKGYPLIRAWREYKGLTQKEVAKRMGITQAALSQMESGHKRLRKVTLEKLAAAMGIGADQLR
ncbi:MAG: helix-turn-helix transcriptional regulator [Thermodesulfobacteriota bacterium]